jgi:hypothetical protein
MAPWLRFIAWATIGGVAASATITTVIAIFQCIPIQSIWNPALPKKCIDVNTFSVATSAANTTLDVIIFMIPLPELGTLKLHWKRKIGVFVVFLTGGLLVNPSFERASLTPLVRLQPAYRDFSSWSTSQLLTMQHVSEFVASRVKFRDNAHQNSAVDNAPTVIWSIFELNISLICACLPAIRPLLGHYFPNFLGSTEMSLSKQPWKNSFGTPPGGENRYRDYPKRQNRYYQSFITSSKQGRGKDIVLEEDEYELRQYEGWI